MVRKRKTEIKENKIPTPNKQNIKPLRGKNK